MIPLPNFPITMQGLRVMRDLCDDIEARVFRLDDSWALAFSISGVRNGTWLRLSNEDKITQVFASLDTVYNILQRLRVKSFFVEW